MAKLPAEDLQIWARRLVVVDTCSFLDIIRLPVRDQRVADPRSIEWIIDAASETPPTVTIALLDVVDREHARQRPGVTQHVEGELRRLDNEVLDLIDRLVRLQRRCAVGPEATPAVHRVDNNWAEAFLQRAIDLGSRALALAVTCATTGDDLKFAHERVMNAQAPAERGGISTTDSIVCEAALRMARGRAAGSTALLTSNDKDFRRGGDLHPDLRPDYDISGLVDARSWADAVSFAQSDSTR